MKFIILEIIESSFDRIFLKETKFRLDLIIPWRRVKNLTFAIDRILKSR